MAQQIERYRLSPQQKFLWSRRRTGSVAQQIIRIEGPLAKDRLRSVIAEVVRSQSILRTSFTALTGDGAPLQVIDDQSSLAWSEFDLSNVDEGSQREEVELLAKRHAGLLFESGQRPALRLTLATLGPARYLLLMTLPLLCADQQALNILFDDIVRRYIGEDPPGSPEQDRVQYVQFSEWRLELLEDEDAARATEFWQRLLVPAVPDIPIPFGSNLNADEQPDLSTSTIRVPLSEFSGVAALAERYFVSPAVVVLTCWMTLLWRMSEERDILVNVLFDGRKYEELSNCVGLLAAFAPVRHRFRPEAAFSTSLSAIEQSYEDSNRWHEYFAGDEVQSLVSSKTADWLSFRFEQRAEKNGVGGVSFSIFDQRLDYPVTKLSLNCCRVENGLTAELQYTPAVFSRDTVNRLASYFHNFLDGAVRAPESPVAELPLLGKGEFDQLVAEADDLNSLVHQHDCFHDLFARQVDRTPSLIAVTFKGKDVTYTELNERANKVAQHLRAMGVTPNATVAILLSRGVELVIAILAVLKAGAAYVPLDPSYPVDRLKFMIEDSGPDAVLTDEDRLNFLPDTPAKVVCIDRDWELIAQRGGNEPEKHASPGDLAYIIYTSGSTGRPKGVGVTHRGLVNYLHWAAAAYAVVEGCSSPVHSPIGFDLTITSLLLPLVVGGRVILVPDDESIDGLVAILEAEPPVSLLKLTPSHLKLLGKRLSAGATEKMLGTVMVVGGENLSTDKLLPWRGHMPRVRIFNEYGPTETVVGCSVYELRPGDFKNESVPIGRPISNTQIYLLDRNLGPRPFGAPGEIYIGGAGLAIGYINRSDLTAACFVPNPFSSRPGDRLYRTGDRARYLEDGNLEFLGRADNQVKIRGFRIELGEIEEALRGLQCVDDAAVIADSEKSGDTRLVAYIKRNPRYSVLIDDVRGSLGRVLPDHMIPSAFVTLSVFPLTANGKLDHKALPEPDMTRPDLNTSYVAPRTELEKTIADIWQGVLNITDPGLNDNFFDLGGHSTLMVEVHDRLQQKVGRDIPLLGLFQFPTIYSLAEFLARDSRETSSEQQVDLLAESRKKIAGRQRNRRNAASIQGEMQ